MEDSCQTKNRPFVFSSRENGDVVVFKPNCGLWSCEFCGAQRAHLWFLHAWRGATVYKEAGKPLQFVTITVRGGTWRSQEASIRAFSASWPKLRKRATYEQKSELDYIAIAEAHKNGVMHLHILATSELKKRWWKDNAFLTGMGYQADVSPVDSAARAAHYVTKYCTKAIGAQLWPKGFRRVRTSQNWPKVADIEPSEPSEPSEVFGSIAAAQNHVWELIDSGLHIVIMESASELVG